MLFENMELHNVTQLKQIPCYPGYALIRLPDSARQHINEDVADLCRSVEIRFFVEEAQNTMQGGFLYLMARDTAGEAVIFWGDYQDYTVIPLPVGVITPVRICYPHSLDAMPAGRFPNRLCRVFLNARSSVQIIGTEHLNIRPPKPDEKPAKTLVGYGSSITHGGVARSNCDCYLQIAARKLGMDALNLGFSGSCHADPHIADYIAGISGDVFFLELGANMIERFSTEEFASRISYTIRRIAQAHPSAAVFATGLYAGVYDAQKRLEYNAAVEECVRTTPLNNLHYLSPDALMPDPSALAYDGIHPSDYGHMLIGEKLAEAIAQSL